MLLLVVFLFLFGLYLYARYRRMTILSRNGIPGPRASLITGNLFDYMATAHVAKIWQYFDKYGPIMGFYLGERPIVLINDLELIKLIQIKDFAKFSDRQRSNLKYGSRPNPKYFYNILTAEGKHWKQMRAILNPSFSAVKMKTMSPIIDNSIDIMMAKIEAYSKADEEFDIYLCFQLLTTDVITKCALGIDTNVQTNPNDEFFKAAQHDFAVPNRIIAFFTCFPEFDFILYPLRRAIQIYREYRGLSTAFTLSKMVEAAINLRSSAKDSKKRNDLLQMMLDAKLSRDKIEHIKTSNLTIDLSSAEQIDDVTSKDGVQLNGGTIGKSGATISLTHEEIVSTACIFYEAGLETTSTALGFIGHILVNNQDIQKKIRQEVIDLHRVEGKFDYNTVNQLKYMQCVIDETMRFYPPVTTFVSRTANEDYHYKNITIPKGATVRIPTEQLHHNEQYWPRHDQFDPERFRDKSAIDSVTFQPFGTGPRNCIGMRFAYYEMKLTLAKLLFKYRLVPGLSTEKELTIEYKISSQSPKNGVFVRALPLKY